jgi:hypothetical protein
MKVLLATVLLLVAARVERPPNPEKATPKELYAWGSMRSAHLRCASPIRTTLTARHSAAVRSMR